MVKLVKAIRNRLILRTTVKQFIKIKSSKLLTRDNNKDKIFIAAMPKAAGTFVSKNLAHNTGLSYMHVGDMQGRCEFDIYLPNFIDSFITKGGVVHQHMNATLGNIQCLNNFGITPVVILRDLEDVLYSMHRHLLNYKNTWPIFSYPKNFFEWDKKQQLDFIIDFIMPQIIYFKVSWINAISQNQIKALIIEYNEIVNNPENTIRSILNFSGLENIENITIHVDNSMRIGDTKKNIIDMDTNQKSRFESLIRYYFG